MKKKLLTIFLLLNTIAASAQKTIAVNTGGNWTFYTDFSSALNQCAPGSTIYLPGGTFILSQNQDTINKPITIIGVGHYPDSTLATSSSSLQGNLYYDNGANSCSFIGFFLTGDFKSTSSNTNITNLRIERCRIGGYCALANIYDVSIRESVFYNVYSIADISNNIYISNSYIFKIEWFNGAILENNIIEMISSGSSLSGSVQNSLIKNNYLYSVSGSTNMHDNTFVNNLCVGSSLPPIFASYNNISINNIAGATLANTFVNVPSNSFNYNYDYHLLPSSAGKNAGTDGTDIGIYGTVYPYKPSAVPANPHISTKSISPSSAPNGTLPVNIRVIAQDR